MATTAAMPDLVFEPIPSRPPPRSAQGAVAWLRANLFDGWRNTAATLIVLALLLYFVPPLLSWGLFHAIFAPENAACQIGRASCRERVSLVV